jgi:hypothetical protein
MKIRIILIIVLLGLTQGLFAQSSKVKVSGKIIDQTTQEPLPYVNVLLKKSSDSTFVTGSISDEAGLFILSAQWRVFPRSQLYWLWSAKSACFCWG